MKKLVTLLSLCLLSQPAMTAQDDIHKKTHKHHHIKPHHEKHNHDQLHHPVKHQHGKHHHLKNKTAVVESTTVGTPAVNAFFKNVSGTFDFTSNYVFRGLSQNNNTPAVQGGLTYTFPIGAYLNVWGSNVNFITPDGTQATIELDSIVGYRKTISDFTFDLSIARYNYPRAQSDTYNEFIGVFIYKILQLTFAYTANEYGFHTPGVYANGTLIFDIPTQFTYGITGLNFQAGVGHTKVYQSFAGNSYDDYSIAITKKLTATYSAMLQWTGTNGRAKFPPNDRNQIIGQFTASF